MPEGWLPGAGGLRLNDSRQVVLCLVGVPGGFVLVWGSPAEVFLDAAGVVPAVMATEDARTSRWPLSRGIESGASLRIVAAADACRSGGALTLDIERGARRPRRSTRMIVSWFTGGLSLGQS